MEKEDLYTIRTLVNEYGARATLKGFVLALKEYADEMSDLGLREKAHEAVEVAELLSGDRDTIE
jgi:hypothetical protein